MQEELETIKDKITSHPTQTAAVAASAIVTVGVLTKIGRAVAKWMRAPKPYSDSDIARHYDLKKSYTKLRASPPANWGLDDDHRPILAKNVKQVREELYKQTSTLDCIISGSIHQCARGMLDTLIKLFDSLAKRKNHRLHKGCLEILFFSELADWLLTKVPFYRFQDKKTLAELCAREAYFQEVLDTILEPDKGLEAGDRNSPIVALKRIIDDLHGIIESSEELIEAQTFSDHISELDNAVVSMSAEIFHAMFLLIEGNHNYELALPVGLFLDRTQIHRPTLTHLQQKRLAYWLEQSLLLAGIEGNDFINTKVVTLEMIEQHLDVELTKHPSFPPYLLDPEHSDWGHWLFLFKNSIDEPHKKLALGERLSEIRRIYQNMLTLYYLRGLLAHARTVAPLSGEVWLYGDKTGHAVISTLMDISTKILRKLETSVSAFYEKNNQLFEKLRSAAVTQYGSESYTSVAAAHARLEEYQVQNQRGMKAIAAIRHQRDTFDTRLSVAKESRHDLIQDIVSFMDHHDMQQSKNYPILVDALKGSKSSAGGNPNSRVSIVPHRNTIEHKLKRESLAQAYYSGSDSLIATTPLSKSAGIERQEEEVAAATAESPPVDLMNNPVELVVPPPASKASSRSTLFHSLYRLFVKQGLSAKERVRYDELVRAYEQLLGENPPPAWADVDNSPLLEQGFDTLKLQWQAQLSSLSRIAPASIHQSAKGILTAIVKLYDSLSKRRAGKIKIISVEELFFTELACWIVHKLPRYDFKSPTTLIELNKMLTYCNTVHKNILIPERSAYLAQRNNPLPVLRHITHDLEGIIKATTELVHSATLNDRLLDLDNAILNMAAQTFHVMYLLINGDHRYESGLSVGLFLDETQQNRPKITEIKKQQLGLWLKNVLDKLGITGNDFKHSKKPTLTEIDALFAGECPTDIDCCLPKKLRNASATEWGFWKFLLQSEFKKTLKSKDVCSAHLLQIRQIYQNLLKLYDLRHFISHARKVAPVYGEVSLYGDVTGRAIMNMLIHISEKTTDELALTFESFFNELYKDFSSLKACSKIMPEDKGYIAMGTAYQQIKIFGEQYRKAQQAILEIITQCKTATSRIEKAEASKTQLLIELVHFSRRRELPLPRDLELAYSNLVHPSRGMRLVATPAASQSNVFDSPRAAHHLASIPLNAVIRSRCQHVGENSTILNLSKLKFHTQKLQDLPAVMDTIIELFATHLKHIKKTVTRIDFSNNGLHSSHPVAHTVLKLFCAEIHRAPDSVKIIDLRGNGFEGYTKEQLTELLQFFPKTVKIYLHGEKPLCVKDQLARLTWPNSYYQMAKNCKGNLIELARLLLNDYTQGNSAILRFFTFNAFHNHIPLAVAFVERIKKKEFPNSTALFKELYAIEPQNPTGELSRRLSFFYYHVYHKLKFEEFNHAVAIKPSEQLDRGLAVEL